MQSSKCVLIVLTSHVTHASGKPTGYWLSEVTHAYAVFQNAGYRVDFMSPRGGEAPMDPASRNTTDSVNAEYLGNAAFVETLVHTKKPSDVDAHAYAAIYYPGGHGPMWDLAKDTQVAQIATQIYEHGGVVSAVCHGPAALLPITLTNGERLLKGKTVAGFANIEERLSGKVTEVPFLLQDALRSAAGRYTKSWLPFAAHVEVDGRLVTGQNPKSAKGVAEEVVRLLQKER